MTDPQIKKGEVIRDVRSLVVETGVNVGAHNCLDKGARQKYIDRATATLILLDYEGDAGEKVRLTINMPGKVPDVELEQNKKRSK